MKKNRIITLLASCILFTHAAYANQHTHALMQLHSTQTEQGIPSLAPILKKVLPSVVSIDVENNNRHYRQAQPEAVGAGVIVNAAKGLIVTNFHVVDAFGAIQVTLEDGRKFRAKLVGYDRDTDIAVLKINAKNLHQIAIANSSNLQVGDFVLAVGNPFGLEKSVSSGIVSGLNRTIGKSKFENYIQTDAPINAGNSGGALVDLKGQLIGLNTAIITPNRGSVGVGFAIPSNMVKHISEQIIQFGNVERGKLGVLVQNMNPDLANALKLDQHWGVLVTEVQADSPANNAGIQSGDVITAINGQQTKSASAVRNIIGSTRIGNNIEINLVRDGKEKKLKATLTKPVVKNDLGHVMSNLDGAYFANALDPSQRQIGVRVSRVKTNSNAWIAGLRHGDVIVSINRKRVHNLQQFNHMVKKSAQGDLLMHIYRGIQSFYLVVKQHHVDFDSHQPSITR